MRINPYLSFDGRCEEAFRTYADVLGGTLNGLMPYAGSPGEADVPPDWGSKIMHACLTIGDTDLMGSDFPPGHSEKPQGFSVSIQIGEPAEAERVFNALAEGGAITMPLEETFWAFKFGMLVDRFGIPWMINCSRPE